MTKATSTNQTIGTMAGQRGIQFVFTLKNGKTAQVVFDFYGAGSQFNGAAYIRIESAAIASMIKAHLDVESFTHYLIPLVP